MTQIEYGKGVGNEQSKMRAGDIEWESNSTVSQ
jgi:hypothetical protein